MLAALVSYAQTPIPQPPIHLLGHNELAWERYTKLWVKNDGALSQHNRHEQLSNQLLPAHIRSEIKSIRLVVDSVVVAASAYKQGFLINATNDTIRIDRADATIANIRTEVYTNGQWLTLQKDMGSRCGNSYWTMALAPNHYIALQIEQLSGPQKVLYRIVIKANGTEVQSDPTTVQLYPALLRLAGTDFVDP